MNYWLFKSEPDEYSIDHLAKEPQGFGRWDGIRNYQARNILRDEVQVGDGVLFYHSRCKVPGVVGIARVTASGYADPAQFDAESPYFDAKSTEAAPRWYCVDVAFVEKFCTVVSLKVIKQHPDLTAMVLVKQGRLSVQPVTAKQWQTIVDLGGQS